MRQGLCRDCGGPTSTRAAQRCWGCWKAHRERRVAPEQRYIADPTTGCWNWVGPTRPNGYGRFGRDGGQISSHRYFWEKENGPVPDGLELDHLCSNPLCCNPSHLEAVTQTENIRRGRATKLTRSAVAQIRASDLPQKELALRFGITQSNVSRIRSGETWIDVEAAA